MKTKLATCWNEMEAFAVVENCTKLGIKADYDENFVVFIYR